MPELGSYGSVRGARGNSRPYRENAGAATRYDKLAANYLAFIKLASIRIWLRANESAP